MKTKQSFSHKKSYLLSRMDRAGARAERYLSDLVPRQLTAPQKRQLYTLGQRIKDCYEDAEVLLHLLPQLDFERPAQIRSDLANMQSYSVTLWRRLSDYAAFAKLSRFPALPDNLIDMREEAQSARKPSWLSDDLMGELETIMKSEAD